MQLFQVFLWLCGLSSSCGGDLNICNSSYCHTACSILMLDQSNFHILDSLKRLTMTVTIPVLDSYYQYLNLQYIVPASSATLYQKIQLHCTSIFSYTVPASSATLYQQLQLHCTSIFSYISFICIHSYLHSSWSCNSSSEAVERTDSSYSSIFD